MREKTGNTIKLIYDFPTEKHLEVKLNEKWYRVTPKTFRSWNGGRRINYYTPTEYTEEYKGPIYFWDTNTKTKKIKKEGIRYITKVVAQKRKTEKFKI
jgi:hypothetical protein